MPCQECFQCIYSFNDSKNSSGIVPLVDSPDNILPNPFGNWFGVVVLGKVTGEYIRGFIGLDLGN